MTWGEIQVITLQKMFVNDEPIDVNSLKELKNNEDYKVFLNSMPAVANEGIKRIYKYAYPKYEKQQDGTYTKIIPEKITENTDNSYELELEEDACVILPLYMASELYKDDDITLSTVYRNEFETELSELSTNIESQDINVIYEM